MKIISNKDITNLSILLLIVTLFGFAGRYYWLMDLFSHFRPQYFLGALILGSASLIIKEKRAIFCNTISLLINLAIIWPLIIFSLPNMISLTNTTYLSANVLSSNNNYSALKVLIAKENPDTLLLLEINEAWSKELSYLKKEYPYYIFHPQANNFGLIFLSRRAYTGGLEFFNMGEIYLPYIDVKFNNNTRFIGLHTLPPVDSIPVQARNQQMADIASKITSSNNERFVVMGDFNDTRWSANFRSFIEKSGLEEAHKGWHFTWPSFFFPLGIQIDHALIKGFNTQSNIITHSTIGSDHFPISLQVFEPIEVHP